VAGVRTPAAFAADRGFVLVGFEEDPAAFGFDCFDCFGCFVGAVRDVDAVALPVARRLPVDGPVAAAAVTSAVRSSTVGSPMARRSGANSMSGRITSALRPATAAAMSVSVGAEATTEVHVSTMTPRGW
jgi:hypothetical protein